MRKVSSTNTLNQQRLNRECGIAYTLSVIGGRWKLSILAFLLDTKKLRYSELRRKMPGVSERMLGAQLKELESDGLVIRTVYPEVPPKVEYQLTEFGLSLKTILMDMAQWGEIHRNK